MQFRLIKPEMDVFSEFGEWIANQYEFLEIVFKAWKSANKPDPKMKYFENVT